MSSEIQMWKQAMEKDPELFIRLMKKMGITAPPQTGTNLRSKLPQEMWDKTSQYFGNPKDWKNMNTIMMERNATHKYPFSKDTPSYKKHMALRNVQKRFTRTRVPYADMLRKAGTVTDNELRVKVQEKLADMLLQGNTSAARVFLNNVVETRLDHIPDEPLNFGYFDLDVADMMNDTILFKEDGRNDTILYKEDGRKMKWKVKWTEVEKGIKFLVKVMASYDEGEESYDQMLHWLKNKKEAGNMKEYLMLLKIWVTEGKKLGLRAMDPDPELEDDVRLLGLTL